MGARRGVLAAFASALVLASAGPAAAQYKADQPKDSSVSVKESVGDRARPQARPRRTAAPEEPDAARAPATASEQCQWLGKRMIGLLIRDDAMGANDFAPFYLRFGCPEPLLAEAFGCVAANLPLLENNGLSAQIDACWHDPSVRLTAAEDKKTGKDEKPQDPAAAGEKGEEKPAKAGAAAPPAPTAKPEKPEKPEPPAAPTKTGDPTHRPN